MEIRDPIHNFLDFRDREVAVINHSAFQRLRRIRQLAMADLVYPGAVHHRFEHSLGVCHVAGRVAEKLLGSQSRDQIDYIRMAALVHDIGHGPFSHVSEEPLAEVNREWLEQEKIPRDKVHEQIGLDIVKHQLRDSNLIDRGTYQQVHSILDTVHNKRRILERDIVSGPLDADKMDYLLRDSLFCGVKYGVYDLERLIRALTVIVQGEDRFIGINAEDIAVVDQYVIARYNMNLQVYGHRTRRATDLMLTRAILEAIKADDQEIIRAYTYRPDDKAFTDQYLTFDDRTLMASLFQSKSDTAQKLARCLQHRELPRRICYRSLGDIRDEGMKQKLLDENKRQEATAEIKQHFEANFSEADPACVFVEVVAAKPVGKFRDLPEVDPEQIMVTAQDWPTPRTLPKVSNFFKDYKFTPDRYLAVYANIEHSDTETHDDRKRRARDVLRELFSETEEVKQDAQ